MSQATVIIIEQSDVVADILRNVMAAEHCPCVVVQQPADFDAAWRKHAPISAVLIDVMTIGRDAAGREVPYWKILAQRAPFPAPIICFSGTNSTPTDTPLFTAPSETLTIASPQDFRAVAQIARQYLNLMERQPLLRDAIAGTLLPSLRGDLTDFDLESLLKLLELGAHTGVVVLRANVQIGLIAFEEGEPTHALVGGASGKEAVITLFNSWRDASFTFHRDIRLGERSISHGIENLILEASRLGDEVTDLATMLPPNSYLRRVKGYTDQLPGKRLTVPEWEVLSLVDRYHFTRDLVARARMSELMALKALRALMQKHLIEVVTADHPEYQLAQRV